MVVEGSPEKILTALPATARQVAMRLGVANPKVLAAVSVSRAEMAVLRQVPWKSFYTAVPAVQVKSLQRIAAREPLAGLLFQRVYW